MKRKNTARNALVTSIISLLLCVSMLVGTTFAWFTDEVVTGMNTIAAGNLDVELLADGNKVDSNTKLFDDVTLWEPGVVIYENLQVANVGTLALKYQMTLNFGDENNLNGHKLSEVLKIAVIDKVADNATREEVLTAAKAAVAADKGAGALSNFILNGTLEAGETGAEKTFVIFWEPNDNAKDNLYNANNDQVTSDGEPLHIKFGINLQATQKMSEEDSFGNDYDEGASILPKATVNDLGVKTIAARNGLQGEVNDYNAPFTLQFLPNESAEEGAASQYKDWHVDFVVKADQNVRAESIALIGYYNEWCKLIDNKWVALIADQDVAANTEVRLVSNIATVSYEEICQYGNDPEDLLPADLEGFLCTAVDLTGANAGTTITVELRMYETDESLGALSSLDSETGYFEVIGTYTYTFVNAVTTPDELKAQLAAGNDVVLAADLDLDADETITIAADKDVTIDLNGHEITATADGTTNRELFLVKGKLTVKNGSIAMDATVNQGWGAMAAIFDVTAGGALKLDGVKASVAGTDMNFIVHLNNWGSATAEITNCDFNLSYCAVRAFNSGYDMNTVTIKNTDVTGSGRLFWVHNYTAEGKDNSTLTLDIYGNGNTCENAKPVRFGFDNSVYFDLDGNAIT